MFSALRFAIADALKWIGWRLVRIGTKLDDKAD
jgi:hypothetical protein